MKFNRSTHKALGLATLVALSAISLSACVATYSDFDYDDAYYPEERPVVIRHHRPVVHHHVEVYESRPSKVIITRPNHHHYQHPPKKVIIEDNRQSHSNQKVIIEKHSHRPTSSKVILNPGRHQQQEVIINPHAKSRSQMQSTVVKSYRNNNETHAVPLSPRTEVKPIKKIVIDSQDNTSPSTLAE